MKALLSHDQTAIWPRLCLRDEFWPRKKVGICCPNATVSGISLSIQLALFSARCPKLRIFHTTGSCSGDNSKPESINRNSIIYIPYFRVVGINGQVLMD